MSIDGFQENASEKDASVELDMKDTTSGDDELDQASQKKQRVARKADASDDQSDDDSRMMDDESDGDSDMDDYDRDDHDYDSDRRKRRKARALGDAVFCRPLEVVVRDDRVEQAIRQLKNRMAREGVLRELKNRRHYFKPSELKRIKSREAARRRRKQIRQKIG